MSDAVTVSIVIPTYNNRTLLQRCLATVMRHRTADSEVIVVDDGSTDSTAEMVRSRWPEVRLLQQPNRGFCAAANQGLRHSRGTFVELLNNDTEVTAGWLQAALPAFDDPTVASVAPLVRKLPYRATIDSAGDQYYWFGMAKKRGEGRPFAPPYDRPVEVFGASASSAFYRREALDKVGGFPEYFGAYLDDIDLGFRLRLAGYRCLFVPDSVVYHWVSRSYAIQSPRMKRQVALNSERVFWTNLTTGQLLMHVAPHLAYVLAQLAYKTVRGDFGPWFAGKCAALAEIPTLLKYRKQAQGLTST